MVVFMKATGTKIICMALAYTNGLTVVNTKEIMSTIKKTDMASIRIQTAGATKAYGKTVSNMEKVCL